MNTTQCNNKEKNLEGCPCASSDCENAGICCDCIRRHLSRNTLVMCQKQKLKTDKDFLINFVDFVKSSGLSIQL